jgi:hypothetical protein
MVDYTAKYLVFYSKKAADLLLGGTTQDKARIGPGWEELRIRLE